MQQRLTPHPSRRLAKISFMVVSISAPSPVMAQATCDALASKMFRRHAQTALQQVGCSVLAKAGLDHADHHVTGLCYSSSGATSHLEVDATLTCKTSDAALIKASITEHIHASTTVVAADCSVTSLEINSPDASGQKLLSQFDVRGLALKALQEQIKVACAP